MSRTTYIVAILLCSVLSYGQQITFHKNVNYRASLLHQNLDEENNLLCLESENNLISQVDIFNNDYSESIAVKSNKTKIDLNSLPNGSFVIQARVDKKWVVMYLEKKDESNLTAAKRKDNLIFQPHIESHFIANHQIDKKNVTYYWVVSEVNSGFGSRKSMRLEYKDDIPKIITKNKLELKSNVGKDNKLIIYEVYDKSAFMNKQFRNPKYYKSTESSEYFNAEPLYASTTESETDY